MCQASRPYADKCQTWPMSHMSMPPTWWRDMIRTGSQVDSTHIWWQVCTSTFVFMAPFEPGSAVHIAAVSYAGDGMRHDQARLHGPRQLSGSLCAASVLERCPSEMPELETMVEMLPADHVACFSEQLSALVGDSCTVPDVRQMLLTLLDPLAELPQGVAPLSRELLKGAVNCFREQQSDVRANKRRYARLDQAAILAGVKLTACIAPRCSCLVRPFPGLLAYQLPSRMQHKPRATQRWTNGLELTLRGNRCCGARHPWCRARALCQLIKAVHGRTFGLPTTTSVVPKKWAR
jgi:hypothetical protein